MVGWACTRTDDLRPGSLAAKRLAAPVMILPALACTRMGFRSWLRLDHWPATPLPGTPPIGIVTFANSARPSSRFRAQNS